MAIGSALTVTGWAILWTVQSFWNPLAFVAMWTGAAVVMWGLSREGYPSLTRHAALAALSVPLWWWFELVNGRVSNWEYRFSGIEYPALTYIVLSSLAFATVVPALFAATALIGGLSGRNGVAHPPATLSKGSIALAIAVGVVLQSVVFLSPTFFYPLVWVAPFLIIDALVAAAGGRSIMAEAFSGRWRLAVTIGAAGLLCGFLWEFWNYWATPKWVYQVPFLEFGKIFEMPVLGYGGYIPFAWSVVQLVRLANLWRNKLQPK